MAKDYLSANPPYVVVTKGDTLSGIAANSKYANYIAGTGVYGTNGKLNTLVTINDITNPDRIVVGQKILLSGSSGSKTNNTSTPVIKAFGLQSDTDRTMYATWTWSKSNTENYRTIWYYDTGDGVWFIGNDSTTTDKQSTYSAPQNANKVRFKVLPVSKTRKVNNKETKYWTANWSSLQTYEFKNNPPVAPSFSSQNVTIDSTNKLTIEMSNLDKSVDGLNATGLQFQIYRNSKQLEHTGKATISNIGYVSYSYTVKPGYKYAVRCRSVRDSVYSDWTDFTDPINSMPAAPSKIIECSSFSENQVYITWSGVDTATSYFISYLALPEEASSVEIPSGQTYFDVYADDVKEKEIKTIPPATTPQTFDYLSNMELGKRYCFRVKAVNEAGSSAWTAIKTVTLGTTPEQPTTWSSSTKVMVGDPLTLYWVHNSEDNSDPSEAKIYFSIVTKDENGDESVEKYVHTVDYDGSSITQEEESGGTLTEIIEGVKGWISSKFTTSTTTSSSDDDEPMISQYEIQTTNFSEGAELRWCVTTKGAKDVHSEESITRTVNIYDHPSVEINITGNVGASEESDFTCYSLPLEMSVAVQVSDFQSPIGYYVSIVSGSRYESVDDVGNVKMVNENETIYSKYFDTTVNPLVEELSAGDIDLENGVKYTLTCTITMDSGLAVEQSATFEVDWTDIEYEPNAEISIDEETVTASIRPYCEYEDGSLVENVTLSVYRREFDGTFTEILKDVKNTTSTFVTDPHPSLDYARYRIVARSENTGGVSYYDLPGIPVDEKAAILQWNETWSDFNVSNEDLTEDDIAAEREQSVWSGSMLKLHYNIDVSENNDSDIEFVKYIGRRHPVGYYGTQVGQASSWSVQIPKDDKETLYALRRLSIWMGDVYVREPSGSGYWASVKVSFSQTHRETTIPVTIAITRIEGGV